MRVAVFAIVLAAFAPSALSLAVPTAPPHFIAIGEGTSRLEATSYCEADGNYAFWWEPARARSSLAPDGNGDFAGMAVCDSALAPLPVHAHESWSARNCAPVGRTGIDCAANGARFRMEEDGAFSFQEVYSDGQVVTVEGRMTLVRQTNEL